MKRIILLLVLILNLWIPAAHAETFVVQNIEVHGLQRISPETVYSYLPIKRGETLNAEKTADAIKALYKTGFFENITLERRGNTLIINLEERPTIGQLKVSGNSFIPTDKLTTVMRSMNIAEGRVYNRVMIERIQQSLLNQYYELGRYNARVEVSTSPMERNRMLVKIDISEGLVAKIRRINIIGNHAFTESELNKQFTITTPGLFTFITQTDRYSQEKLDESIQNLRNFYLDHGYLKVEVKSAQVAITPDRKSIYLTFVINEGEQYKVTGVALTGDLIIPREELMKKIKIKSGDTFSRQAVMTSEKQLSEAYGNKGYVFAVVNLNPNVNAAKKEVFLTFDIKAGKRAYVRHIYFVENTKTNDEVLRREIQQLEAAPVSTGKLEASKQRLSLLPYVKDVDMRITPVEDTDDQVDVNYKVTEDNAAQANLSLGYSQNQGVLLGAGINQKNFLGTGKTVGFNITRSRYQQFYGASYTNPYYTPDGISRSINVSASTFDPGKANVTSSYTTNQYDASVLYGIPIGQEKGAFTRLQLGYGYENTKMNLTNSVSQQVMDFVTRNGRHFEQFDVIAGLSRDSRDRAIFPTRGSLQTLGTNVYLPALTGDLSYYSLSYTGRWYQPITRTFIATARGGLGFGSAFNGVENYPVYKNFYAGGLNSPNQVRGFVDNSLGPKDSNGKSTGGNAVATGSLGLIFPNYISENFRTMIFADGGNVYETFNNRTMGGTAAGPLRYSVGIEGDWLTMFGLIDVSLAKPLNKQPNQNGINGDSQDSFQFSLGANFG